VSAQAPLKCVIWDLDDTLWDGTLLEDGDVALPEDVRASVIELDRRGVLQSLASRAERGPAEARLRDFGLFDYFLYPQFGDQPKSVAVAAIAAALDISLDSVALVDDQAFDGYYTIRAAASATLRGAAATPFVLRAKSRRRALYRRGMSSNRAIGSSFLFLPDSFAPAFLQVVRCVRTNGGAPAHSTGRCLAGELVALRTPDHSSALDDRLPAAAASG
jgi:HAD superfamily phosphatase (TIGR01681 family)